MLNIFNTLFEQSSKALSDPMDTREAITQFLFLKDEPTPVDLCFVLGSPSISSILPAVALFKQGLTPKILISGHGPQKDSIPEWQVYRDYAIANGVPESAILVEKQASNTLENFTFSKVVIEQEIGWENLSKIALVAKPFHMRRVLMTASRQWPAHLQYSMQPSNAPDDPPAETWWETSSGRNFVLAELKAIGTYGLADHIGGF